MYAGEATVESILGPVLPPGEPDVRAIVVTTVNGSATIDGSSRALGNDLDHAFLNALRDWSDVVLVGSETVTVENYFGVRTSPEIAERRVAQGQSPVPPLAVLTRQLSLDPDSQFFHNTSVPPLLLVPDTSLTDPALAERRERLTAAGAVFVPTGTGSAPEVLAALHERDLHRIDCEGGPEVFSEFFRADLIDVLYLTVSPLIHAPVEKQLAHDVDMELTLEHHSASEDGTLFLRYRRGDQTLR